MADGTKIEWTDATWNIITGCSVVSPGCKHCYAMKLAGTRLKNHESRAGLTVDTKEGPVWTGEVRFNEGWLDQPLRWAKPRQIFICAHGDLFHAGVTDEQLDRIFAVMGLASQHIFQVLTKRPDRMRDYLSKATGRIADAIIKLRRARSDTSLVVPLPHIRPGAAWWPLANVWCGVSVEDQQRMLERAPVLKDTPAAVRWWSAEPLLGDLGTIPPEMMPDWVVVGGESGPGARPMHPDWARSLREQCAQAGVPFHFKQWGAWLPAGQIARQTGLWDPACGSSLLTTKKNAGRLLDGVEHNGVPA
ncbi:MAG TPA: phage Gp37/Gp68 family protein [Allosphingosinicella sp.]